MSGPDADNRAHELRGDVAAKVSPQKLTPQREGKADGRVHVCAGDGAKDQDQNDEDRAGRKRVAEQGEGDDYRLRGSPP